jgi:alpha-beta hydrolase superfamily lysophospholipase
VPHLLGAEREPEGDGMERLRLLTDGGAITCRLHPTPEGDAAVLWVFGAGGGLGGPADGLYPRLAQRLRSRGVLSVELAWRQPARMGPCVADLLAGLDWLAGQGRRRVALAGHSFGGAVVSRPAPRGRKRWRSRHSAARRRERSWPGRSRRAPCWWCTA